MLLVNTRDTIPGDHIHMVRYHNPRYVKEPNQLWWNYATTNPFCQLAIPLCRWPMKIKNPFAQKAMGETRTRKVRTASSTFSGSFRFPQFCGIEAARVGPSGGGVRALGGLGAA